MPELTAHAAQAIQKRVTTAGGWIMWFVGQRSDRFPGKVVAWAMVADRFGGHQEGGELVASTLLELRAMLPAGLMRREWTPFLPPDVVETWD